MPALVVLAGALLSLLLLHAVAPRYLAAQGLPLDDAWIHAVYGRALAGGDGLSYNPGVPATGETSPLWAVIVALPHMIASDPAVAVCLLKLLGFSLHALAAVLAFHALGAGRPWARLSGALLVACHPDLVAASVSGMESPLAEAFAFGLLAVARRGSALSYAALCVLAPFARPELALVSVLIPALLFARPAGLRTVKMLGAAAAGTAAWLLLFAARNLSVSGLPLPATFYAKVGVAGVSLAERQRAGLALLDRIPVAGLDLLLAAVAVLALHAALSREEGERPAAAAALAGLLFLGASFALIHALDPDAFYHQRYPLPGVPLLLVAIPSLAERAFASLGPRPLALARAALGLVLAGSVAAAAPERFARLSNDARNIDDVQVAEARSLAGARPQDVAWAVDAGALRYFGGAFVVDMMALNTPALLGEGAQAWLDAHPPRFLQVVPTWSALDQASAAAFPHRSFRPGTPYTITRVPAFQPMRTHHLVTCPAGSPPGGFQVRGRVYAFRCAP